MVDYLYNLYQYTLAVKGAFPFAHLLNYAFKNGYMDKRIFDDPKTWSNANSGLHNYLNF